MALPILPKPSRLKLSGNPQQMPAALPIPVQLRMVDEKTAAVILGVTVRCLQAWRTRRKGPTYHRMARRAIRYRLSDLEAFLNERRCVSTSEY